MFHRCSRLFAVSAGLMMAASAVAFPGPGGTFVVKEDLGALPGHAASSSRAINASRQIAGVSGETALSFSSNAFRWTPPGSMIALEPIDKLDAANDINDDGYIVGDATFLDFAMDSFLWSPNTGTGVFIQPPPGNIVDESATGINTQGEIVGYWEKPPFNPYLWVAPGPAMTLGTLGGDSGLALDINDSTEVVGRSETAGGVTHAFYWSNGSGIVDLGPFSDSTTSGARAINNNSEIVGSVQFLFAEQAALWPFPGAPFVSLGSLGGITSVAHDINDNGTVVGESSIAFGGPTHAFRKTASGSMSDLGTLGGQNSKALGINNAGHVVGQAEKANGDIHAVAWWHYRVPDALACKCEPIPQKPPTSADIMKVLIPSDGRLDARFIEPSTLTLGDAIGDDAPVVRDARGDLIVERVDHDDDGDVDLIVSFDISALSRDHHRRRRANQLWLQGALLDRGNGVYGIITLGRKERR